MINERNGSRVNVFYREMLSRCAHDWSHRFHKISALNSKYFFQSIRWRWDRGRQVMPHTLCLASRAGVYRLVAPPDGTTAVSPQSLIRVTIVNINKQLHFRCVVTHLDVKWCAQWATTWFHWKANSKDRMTDWCHFIPTQPFLPGNRPSTFIRHKPVRKSIMFFVCLFVLLSQLLQQQNVSGTDLM